MSRYAPVGGSPTHTRNSSLHTTPSRRTSSVFNGRLLNNNNGNNDARGRSNFPDASEMDAAFDMSDDEDDDDGRADRRGLLSKGRQNGFRQQEQQFTIGGEDSDEEDSNRIQPNQSDSDRTQSRGERYDDPLRDERVEGRPEPAPIETGDRMPGSYDFDRDFFLTPAPSARPASPPPFFPYWTGNPAPNNSNGIIPTSAPNYPQGHPSHRSTRLELIGSLLPSFFHPRTRTAQAPALGGGHTGVFANLSARPELPRAAPREGEAEGPEWIPEVEGKDVPPTYQDALRDAVPPYWETTVVLPSSSGPFGTMTSSITGDEILIDGMPVGNFFIFAWNLLVSVSFQFVGFLLTYVLHTSHAAKHGSRAGLGITLIQYGLYLHTRAEKMIDTNQFPHEDSEDRDPNNDPFENVDTLRQYWRPGYRTPAHWSSDGTVEIPSFKSPEEAKAWEMDHVNLNMTMAEILQEPTARQVGQANEYLSFMLMAVGWFIFLTSIGGYWRVKRFENGLRSTQSTTDDPTTELANEPADPEASDPRRPAYYMLRASRALNSVLHMGRNMRGSLYYFNLPPLGRGGTDENASRRGVRSPEVEEADGADGYLLFDRGRDREVDMEDGADLPSAAASQGLTTEEWSRRNLYNG